MKMPLFSLIVAALSGILTPFLSLTPPTLAQLSSERSPDLDVSVALTEGDRHTAANQILATCWERVQLHTDDVPGETGLERNDQFATILVDCQEQLEEAIALYQSLNDQENKAKALLLLGYAHERFSDYYDWSDDFSREQQERGDAALKEALAFYQHTGDLVQQATALHLLGTLSRVWNDKAVFLEQAIALYQQLDADSHADSDAGNTRRDGETQLAVRFQSWRTFEDVLLRPEETSWTVVSAEALRHLGVAYHGQAEANEAIARELHERAIASLEQSAAMAASANQLTVAAEAWFELGLMYRELNQESQAVDVFERAVTLTRDGEGVLAEAKTLSTLARRYAHGGNAHTVERAIAYAHRALDHYQELGRLDLQAETLRRIGYYYTREQFYDQAFEFQMQAMNTANQIEDVDVRERIWFDINWSNASFQNSAPEKALRLEQRELEIYQEWGDLNRQAESLDTIGHIHVYFLKQYREALDAYQAALAIYQQLDDLPNQAAILFDLGDLYQIAADRNLDDEVENSQSGGVESVAPQYELALQFHQQSIDLYLEITNATPDPEEQEDQLYDLAERIFELWHAYPEDWERLPREDFWFRQQALDIYQRLGRDTAVAKVLISMGNTLIHQVAQYRYESLATGVRPVDTPEIRAKYERGLALHREAIERYEQYEQVEDIRVLQQPLFYLYTTYAGAGAYDQALEFIQSLSQITDSPAQEAWALEDIADRYKVDRSRLRFPNMDTTEVTSEIYAQTPLTPEDIADYHIVLEYQQQALDIYQQLDENYSEAILLANIGYTYELLQDFEQASAFYERSHRLVQQQNDLDLEARFITNIFKNYYDYKNPNKREQWFNLYHRALEIYRELGNIKEEGLILYRIGSAYKELEQYDQATRYLEEAIQTAQHLEEPTNFADWYYRSLGEIMIATGQYERSLEYFDQEISVHQQEGDRHGELFALNNIATLYLEANQVNLALQFHQRYLSLFHTQGTPTKELTTLINLGQQYQDKAQFDPAFEFYQQALALGQLLQDNPNLTDADWTGIIFGHLGSVFNDQDQTELAITFYKAAINRYEGIRASYSGSSDVLFSEADFAAIFLDKHIDDYRTLADLLLQQNRILEAQQVLDLLKIQELDDYLQDVQRSGDAVQGATLRIEEQDVLERFLANQDQLVALGRELRQLEAIPRDQRTPDQTERVKDLRQLQFDAKTVFQAWLDSDEVQALVENLRQTTGGTNLELAQLNGLQDNLKQLQQNAIALYPLVLDDRLELVVVTANAPPVNRTVDVSRDDLNRAIADFRSTISSPRRNAVIPARQLYNWLIRPIEADLAQADAEVILYAPDAQLRYIPLAALHDGEQWLTQRFQVNNIVAATLSDLNHQSQPSSLNVLAAAFTEGEYAVNTSTRTLAFGGLEFAGQEVENLAQLIPQTEKRLNQDFDQSIVFEMNDYDVVHLATHASFNPGPAEDSFILFGDGTHASLESIKRWTFPNVELVVLSACETAVGDILGDGTEVLGLGYLMQNAGAEAAIASLWSVSDGGTQVLMDAFYAALNNGYSKVEALQRAQRSLITGDQTALAGERGVTIEIVDSRTGEPLSSSSDLSHPYYWAPFILIGNGL